MQVYLDEINTASCLGLFKEIITDKSIDGDVSQCGILSIAGSYVNVCSTVC